MRALVLTNLYPPHALGGYERACGDVVDRWREAGHEVAVLTSSYHVPGVNMTDAPDAGVDRVVPPTSLYALPAPFHRRVGRERVARRAIDHAISGARPDVSVVWNAAGLPLSAVRRIAEREIPTVFVVADAWLARASLGDPWVAPFHGSLVRRALGRLVAFVTRTPTMLPRWERLGLWVFCSDALRRQVAEATGTSFDDAPIVPLGVDLRDFPMDGAVSGEAGYRPWAWRLIFVGRLEASKGIDTLLRAVALLPSECTLDVCGPAEVAHVERVRRLACDLGIADRVVIEAVDRAELAVRYRAADVCVFPSEWPEPFGVVPLEAMACSTPVIASGTGGSAEYLRDGSNCLIAPPGDPSAIARALHGLAGNPALCRQIVEGGRLTAAALTADRLATSLEHLALSLIHDRGRT